MVRVDLDDAQPPSPSINIQSTNYHVLPSGNLGSSSHVLDIPASPQRNTSYDDPVAPADDPLQWNDEPRLEPDSVDPAYLDHLDEDYVAARRPRLYVRIFWPYIYVILSQCYSTVP